MCENFSKNNIYEKCDFCNDLLPINHFYPVNTTQNGRNIPIDMIEERQLKICNWCFSEMIGVHYHPIKSAHKHNDEIY